MAFMMGYHIQIVVSVSWLDFIITSLILVLGYSLVGTINENVIRQPCQ
jgi:hypothetical protein